MHPGTLAEKQTSAKLKPFTSWLKRELDEDGSVSNKDAKAKYTDLFGAPKSQRVWSRFSARMRKRFGLASEKAKNADGQWEYFWSNGSEDRD